MGKRLALRLVILALVLFSIGSPAPEWEPLYQHFQLEFGEETYSILVIRPMPIHAMLLAVEKGAARELLRAKLKHQRYITRALLYLAKDAITDVYRDRGVFGPQTTEVLTGGLGDLRAGVHPLILVTRYVDPFRILQTISVGGDRDGLPTERRLRDRGMKPLPRQSRRIEAVPIRFVPTRGALLEDEEVSRFLSRIQRWVGDVAEIKTFTRSRFSEHNFAPVLHRLLVAHGLTLFGAGEIDDCDRLPPLSVEDQKIAAAIEAKYPEIDRGLLYPDRQKFLVNDRVYLRAGGDKLAKLYDRVFAFGKPEQSIDDPDDPGVISHILGTDRVRFETETWSRLEGVPDVALANLGEVRDNPWGPLQCATMIDVRTVTPEHWRRYRVDRQRHNYTASVRWFSGPPIGADWP